MKQVTRWKWGKILSMIDNGIDLMVWRRIIGKNAYICNEKMSTNEAIANEFISWELIDGYGLVSEQVYNMDGTGLYFKI